MFVWFGKVREIIKHRSSHERCYNRQEDAGFAVFGYCSGVYGGTSATEYLQEHCVDCPHLVLDVTKRMVKSNDE